jgi:hypothetical protein
MTSFFQTVQTGDAEAAAVTRVAVNPWKAVLGVLALVLLLGGMITVAAGLSVVGNFANTVLGEDQRFDAAVATAIVGGVAILLGIVVGTCWLVLGALGWTRRS